ncbi:hypothetical protein PS865_05487 [Pseudomonas fluorescens]|nr:hypothetical protein PS865_05487 [Pseudomonas fluorescens]
MAMDVFDHHDCIVNDKTDSDDNGHERQVVQA